MVFPIPNHGLVLARAYWRNPERTHFISIKDDDGFKNIPVRNITDGVRQALKLSEAGADVYIALAEYASPLNRTAENVVFVSGFWLDVDVDPEKAAAGKGYATVEEADEAMLRCCTETGIPQPTYIVSSGRGRHVHWIITVPLDPATWKSVAQKLKAVTKAAGLRADPPRTADIASILRLPGTLNRKYDPSLSVTLVKSSSEYIDTDTFCRAVEEAYERLCPGPVVTQPRAMIEPTEPHGAPDLDRLRTALATLDPDCDEEKWTFYLAAMARAAREYPQLAEALRMLAIEWSSGALRGVPSRKWTEPGGNGLTGEQYFDQVWNRFLREEDRDGSVITLGTIFHDAKLAGGPTDVLPAEPLSYLQSRYGLILQGGDLYGVRLIDADLRQLFIKERALRRLMRRDLKKRFPVHPGPTIEQFFDSPLTTLFLGVYCHPTDERPDRLNLWRGPVLEPKPGDCTLILAFLLHVICDGDELLYEYLMNYLAHLLQRPEDKPGVIIILMGGQGTGKGTFGHLLRRIFGDGYLHVHQIDRVLGNFNGALERSYVVFLDEAFFFGDRRHTEALKSLVTEPTVTINEKHQPTRQVESFHRFIIATNAEHVKHTDADDRRDFVLPVSNRHRGDAAYWDALYREIDGTGPAALMHELLQRDLSHFNVRRRPVTQALIDQRVQSLDDVGRWLLQCLRDGYIEGFGTDWPRFLSTMQALELIEAFAGARRHRRLTPQELVPRVLKLCPSAVHGQPRMHGGRRHGFTLPPLEVAREEFEQHIEGEIAWEP